MLGMMPQKKKMASLILGEMSPEGSVESGVSNSDMACEECAAKVLSAVESKDPKALASAMRELVGVVMNEYEMSED